MSSKKTAPGVLRLISSTFMIDAPINDLFPVGASGARDASSSALEESRS